MPDTPAMSKVILEYDDVVPPTYQQIEIVGPLNTAAEQLIAQQLHFHLLSVPPTYGLQLSRAAVSSLADLIKETPELGIYRTCIRWTANDPNFNNQADVRDCNVRVACFIIRLLESRSPIFGTHLVKDGFVDCRVFPDCLQFWFPNFRFN